MRTINYGCDAAREGGGLDPNLEGCLKYEFSRVANAYAGRFDSPRSEQDNNFCNYPFSTYKTAVYLPCNMTFQVSVKLKIVFVSFVIVACLLKFN